MRTVHISSCVGWFIPLFAGAVLLAGLASILEGDAASGQVHPVLPIATYSIRLAKTDHAQSDPAWGEPHNGLRIGVYTIQSDKAGQGQSDFGVVLENVGENDLVLNLGLMLANGKTQKVHAIHFLISGAGEPIREMRLRSYGIAGRVDPMVVPLPKGASYTIRCILDQYVVAEPETGFLAHDASRLQPGTYKITAVYEGKLVKEFINTDMEGFGLMPYWTGTIRSAELPFNIARGHELPPA
jgi:hypothetical protein